MQCIHAHFAGTAIAVLTGVVDADERARAILVGGNDHTTATDKALAIETGPIPSYEGN